MMTFLTSFWCRLTNPAVALWAGVGTSSWLCPAPPATTVTTAPRTPDTREWSDTIRAATVRTGDRWVHNTHYIGIFYPVISISILQLSTLNCSRQEAGPGGGAAGGNLTCFTGPGYELATISSRRPLTSFSGKIIEEQSLVQLLEFLQTSSSTFESSMEISTLFNPSVFGL